MDFVKEVLPVLAFLGQAGLVFFFLGKMKGSQDGSAALFAAYQAHQAQMLSEYKASTAAAMAELKGALAGLDAGSDRHARDRATLREEIAAFKATTEAEARFTRESIDRIGSDVHSLQRQMANVAAGTQVARAGPSEMSGPKL